jgi:hypothetical protein
MVRSWIFDTPKAVLQKMAAARAATENMQYSSFWKYSIPLEF